MLPVDGSLPPPKPADPPPKVSSDPPLKLHVVTHLGPDLEIRRDTMLRAYIAQGPTIDIGEETKISGELTIPRGYIELQGKRFQIEKGTVKFTGQPPGNPVVIATAGYEAQDGTKVFADFVGPVKTGKLTLRSEPRDEAKTRSSRSSSSARRTEPSGSRPLPGSRATTEPRPRASPGGS